MSVGGEPQKQAPKPSQPQANPNLRMAVDAGIALSGLGFSAYLFTVGQPTVGGALAGMIIGHYFSAANGQAASTNALSAVAAVGNLLKPPQG